MSITQRVDSHAAKIGWIAVLMGGALLAVSPIVLASARLCLAQQPNPQIAANNCSSSGTCTATQWGDTTDWHLLIPGPQVCVETTQSPTACYVEPDEACYTRTGTVGCLGNSCDSLINVNWSLTWQAGTVSRRSGTRCR